MTTTEITTRITANVVAAGNCMYGILAHRPIFILLGVICFLALGIASAMERK